MKLVTEKGTSVSEAARTLGIAAELLHRWKKALQAEGDQAFPGNGNLPPEGDELRRLRAENARLRAERDTLKKLRRSSPGSRRELRFVEDHRERWPVSWLCDVLGVSTSGYSSGLGRDTRPQEQRRETLAVEVEAAHAEVKARYGTPRTHAELVARGHDCCANTVARAVREAGISARTRRTFRHTTDSNRTLPVAENVLARDVDPPGPNRSWVADLTAIPTREGRSHLAAVEDLFSRMVVGWSMAAPVEGRLVADALGMAVLRRLGGPPSSDLVAHSDRGSPYASEHHRGVLAREGIVCRMSRRATAGTMPRWGRSSRA